MPIPIALSFMVPVKEVHSSGMLAVPSAPVERQLAGGGQQAHQAEKALRKQQILYGSADA